MIGKFCVVSKRPILYGTRRKANAKSKNEIFPVANMSSIVEMNETKAKLERVLGCTAISRSSVSVDDNKGIVAYPAGATVILYNPRSNAQAHLIGTTKNTITCLSFSHCGRYLTTGESGHEPRLRVWELYDSKGQFAFTQIVDIKHHQLGISCVRFTPDGCIVSVGNQHDRAIVVWDWRTRQKIAENRLTSKVNSVDITHQGGCVTVGIRHVKFWHVTKKAGGSKSVPLQGRSAILADQRNNTFLDVCCASNNRTFSITETSLLVEFHDKKLVSTYDLHGEVPRSIVLGNDELFIGFDNGFIRCLDTTTMKHKFTFSKPHYLACDVAEGVEQDALLPESHPIGCRYPDVRALIYNKKTGMLTVIYSDRSIYTWQQIGQNIFKISSQLFHVGPTFSLEVYPPSFPWLPQGSFITSGADDTIRIWNVDHRSRSADEDKYAVLPHTNVFSEDLKKVVLIADSDSHFRESPDQVLGASLSDSGSGVKSLKVSPDGRHLASGGRDGNLCVYDLTVPGLKMIAFFEAHESDIMCLEYSDPQSPRYLLATGSRDRMVHLFDPVNNYQPLASIDDHASTVNSIIFVQEANNLLLISSAADRSIIFRKMIDSEPSSLTFSRTNQVKSQFGLNCVVLSNEGLVAACQDRQLRTYSIQGKLMKQIKGAASDDGQLTKVRLDASGTYAATVCTNRNVYIVDVGKGECLAVLTGQSDNITDVAFSADCRRLYVISYSGCIFVWRLSNFLVNKMVANLAKIQNTKNFNIASAGKAFERSETPDSLLGSGSDAAGDDQLEFPRNAKVKDSESEFGSLNSVRIVDDDSDSCIGQRPTTVVINTPYSSAIADDDFEMKRVTTEVVRRSTSGIMNEQLTSWDTSSVANDFSDDEPTPPTTVACPGVVNFAQQQLDNSVTIDVERFTNTPSYSRSNLRLGSQLATAVTAVPNSRSNDSDDNVNEGTRSNVQATSISTAVPTRRPRKRWDMVTTTSLSDSSTHPSPLIPGSLDIPCRDTYIYPQPSSSKDNVLGGFMTMNGTKIKYSPRSSQRTVRGLSSSISAQEIAELQQHFASFPYNGTNANGGEFVEPSSTPTKTASPMFSQSSNSAFSRAAVKRCSLTKRLKSTGNNESQTVWTPPLIGTRRSTSNMHYSTVTGRTNLSTRRKDDYASSDLHLRSRSQSPSQLALNSFGIERRKRQDSDMSAYSTLTMASARLTPSSSRTNLRAAISNNKQNSLQTLNRLTGIRDKLRKSQENLASPLGYDGSVITNSNISRSKSFGNLRLTAAAPLGRNWLELNSVQNTSLDSCQPDLSRPNADTTLVDASGLTTRSRLIARSVGNLCISPGRNEVLGGSGHSSQVETAFAARTERSLAKTIESLKKASNPDLSHLGVTDTNDALHSAENGVGHSFSLGVRSQKGKGAVQKRVERYQPRNRISRETTSGESDSNSSEINGSPLLQGGNGIVGQQFSIRRYFTAANDSNRSASCVESMPRPGLLQTRRIFEPQQRHSSSNTTRRVPSYLAQKLAGNDIVAPDVGSDECPRQATPSSELVAFQDFDGKTHQSKQMAKHIAECLEQFNTGLDKVLQARQLLETSQDLPVDDRETMLRLLNQAMRTSRKRMGCTDDRYDPDGGHSESPGGDPGQQQCTQAQIGASSDVTTSQCTPTTGTVDPAEFFQQHGQQLLALLQQNMAKQN